MKTTKIIYWTLTAIVGLMMTFSAVSYLGNPDVKVGFQHLGFPDYFRVELAIAKFLGVIALLAPISSRIKEWAYAGFAINFLSAAIAHLSSGDGIQAASMPIIFLLVLAGSYITYHKIHSSKKEFKPTV